MKKAGGEIILGTNLFSANRNPKFNKNNLPLNGACLYCKSNYSLKEVIQNQCFECMKGFHYYIAPDEDSQMSLFCEKDLCQERIS